MVAMEYLALLQVLQFTTLAVVAVDQVIQVETEALLVQVV
jgi:hypothetical protein